MDATIAALKQEEARAERPRPGIALAAGVLPQTLRKIESSRVPTPSFSTVAMLATTLGLSLDTVCRAINEAAATAAGCGPAPRKSGGPEHQ